MIKNLFSKQNICLSKISVYHGFFSYNPGVISVRFPDYEAASRGAKLTERSVLEKVRNLADCGLNGVQKFIDQQMGQRLLNWYRHTGITSEMSGRVHEQPTYGTLRAPSRAP